MSLTFLHPGLLWALLAIAVPVLIHRLLRPRPRRVRFPAVQMLAAELAAGRRSQRLSDWRLLAVRCALVGLLALLLAGPRCAAPDAAEASADVQTGVIVLDESWSTAASRADQPSEWERLRDAAVDRAERAARRWGVGAELGLVSTSGAREPVWPTAELPWLVDRLRRLEPPAPSAAPLGQALAAAGRMLERGRPGEREIFIASDLAAHAWRDVPSRLFAKVAGLRVSVLARPPRSITNLSLVDVRAARGVHAAGLPIRLDLSLRAAGLPVDARASLFVGERVLAQAGPWRLAADAIVEQAVVVPPLPPGIHGLEVQITPADRLEFDQRRFIALACGPKPVVWLVDQHGALSAGSAAAQSPDTTTLLLCALLAPDALPAEQQPLRFRHVAIDDIARAAADSAESGGEADAPQLICLLPVASVSEAARATLERLVQGGATLLLAPGDVSGAALDWPGLRRRISSAAPAIEALAAPQAIVPELDAAAPGESDALTEISRGVVTRRVSVRPENGAIVLARYRDGAPAILQVRLGRGRVVLLTTSPDPAWSELGIRAAGLLAWLHELAQSESGRPMAVDNVEVGAECSLVAPVDLGEPAELRVWAGGDAPETPPRAIELIDGRPRDGWPAAEPGLHIVAVRDEVRAAYAVNWPAAEGDLAPVDEAEILTRLGVEHVNWVAGDAGGDGGRSAGWWPRAWRPELVLAISVLLVLAIEQILAAGRVGQSAG